MKNGTTVITISIITVFSITLLCVCLVYIIECITPFILHQKLQSVATKYMYIIEKYGYLTKQEKEYMMQELTEKGFISSNIQIIYPETPRSYGETLELKLIYKYIQSMPLFGMDCRELIVNKVSYSKI